MIQNPIVTCDMCRTNSYTMAESEYKRCEFEPRKGWLFRSEGGKIYDVCPNPECVAAFDKQRKEAEQPT